MENENKTSEKQSKSFFLYAGLIFLIAFLIILISCFGQAKINRETLPEEAADTMNIQERAAAVSAENARLVEENISLRAELDEKTAENAADDEQKIQLNDALYNTNLVLGCYILYRDKSYDLAKAQLDIVNTELLSPDAADMYNELSEKINKKIQNDNQ